MISSPTINEAYDRIKPFVKQTPLMSSKFINALAGANIIFKCENFQTTGSFKMRGATNAILQWLNDKSPNQALSVVTHSSGNHGQALAKAAQLLQVKATVVMPHNSAQVKLNAVRNFGAEIVLCEPTQQARESTVEELAKQSGAFVIPPFNHHWIIAGQATSAYEMLAIQQVRPDYIFTPVGGGGLLAGTALAAKFNDKAIKVIGCEPQNVNDAYLSFNSKTLIKHQNMFTLADGLRTNIGPINFDYIINNVHDIVTVTEQEMIDAMLLIFEKLKICLL